MSWRLKMGSGTGHAKPDPAPSNFPIPFERPDQWSMMTESGRISFYENRVDSESKSERANPQDSANRWKFIARCMVETWRAQANIRDLQERKKSVQLEIEGSGFGTGNGLRQGSLAMELMSNELTRIENMIKEMENY